MALTFSQMTDQILAETDRDPSFTTAVQNAITSAIKELEMNQFFVNTAFTILTLPIGADRVTLPEDFISVLELQLVAQYNTSGAPLTPNTTVFTAANGFREMTFWELKTYQNYYQPYGQWPWGWALWGNELYVTPYCQQEFYLHLFYYKRDGTYPPYSNPNYISIWMGDFTQDVTRYTARGIFYRDSLQSPELSQSDFDKAAVALSQLKARSGQREVINTLSM